MWLGARLWSSHESYTVSDASRDKSNATAASTSFLHQSIPSFLYSSFWSTVVNNGLVKRDRSARNLRLVIRYVFIMNQMVFMLQGWRRGLDAPFSVLEHPCSLVDTEQEMWDVHDIKRQCFHFLIGWWYFEWEIRRSVWRNPAAFTYTRWYMGRFSIQITEQFISCGLWCKILSVIPRKRGQCINSNINRYTYFCIPIDC